MRDLETAGNAVAEAPVSPPTPVEVIEARGRHRQRRGARIRVAAALACVMVLAGGAALVGVAVDRHTTKKPTLAIQPRDNAAITAAQMRAHLGVDAPKGWVPVDYGDARVFVPHTWKVVTDLCPGRVAGYVGLGDAFTHGCEGAPPSFVGLSATLPDHSARPTHVVNGYALYAAGTSYVVPALQVTIRADGPRTDQVLATLAPSSELVALTYRRAGSERLEDGLARRGDAAGPGNLAGGACEPLFRHADRRCRARQCRAGALELPDSPFGGLGIDAGWTVARRRVDRRRVSVVGEALDADVDQQRQRTDPPPTRVAESRPRHVGGRRPGSARCRCRSGSVATVGSRRRSSTRSGSTRPRRRTPTSRRQRPPLWRPARQPLRRP